MTSTTEAPPASATFMGHPRGLLFLSFTEAWERFSFYGMQALLVVYMVDQALTPGNIESILGMGGFRTVLEGIFGPLSTQALSSQIFGLYTGLVYLTPLIGGWIGDQVLGQKKTVILGGLLMAAGHLLMAFNVSFLLALLLLILGSGCLKGNISAQVGAMYSKADPKRTSAFAIFNLAINIGAMVAPVACSIVGKAYGFHYGFALAAAGMVFGLAIYTIAGRHLPADTLKPKGEPRPRLESKDTPILIALAVVLLVGVTLTSIAYAQEFNVMTLWARTYTDLNLFGYNMPETMLAAFDGFFIVLFTPLVMRYWAWQVSRGKGATDLTKIGWGCIMCAVGIMSLVAASWIAAQGGKPGVGWAIFCLAANGLAFIYNWPTALALCSRSAPAAIGGIIMGVAFLTSFVSNYGAGWIGSYYEKMTPVNFWLLHAALSAAGGVLVWILYKPLARILHPEAEAGPLPVEVRGPQPNA